MNIDDLKLPGTDTSVCESPVPAAPQESAPMGPTPAAPVSAPVAPSTQDLPDVSDVIATEQAAQVPNIAPAEPQMTPFAACEP